MMMMNKKQEDKAKRQKKHREIYNNIHPTATVASVRAKQDAERKKQAERAERVAEMIREQKARNEPLNHYDLHGDLIERLALGSNVAEVAEEVRRVCDEILEMYQGAEPHHLDSIRSEAAEIILAIPTNRLYASYYLLMNLGQAPKFSQRADAQCNKLRLFILRKWIASEVKKLKCFTTNPATGRPYYPDAASWTCEAILVYRRCEDPYAGLFRQELLKQQQQLTT